MERQLQLTENEIDSDENAVSTSDTRAPGVWIEEIRILRELEPNDESLIRQISLRRGMNILWAKPAAPDIAPRLFQGPASGHAAGKTTLCRFIRYLLGEPTFGDDALRREVRGQFPRGWILGSPSWMPPADRMM